jgi:hypothetical protein
VVKRFVECDADALPDFSVRIFTKLAKSILRYSLAFEFQKYENIHQIILTGC